MSKQTPELDWQIVENDEAWERQHALGPPERLATTSSPHPIRRAWLGIAILFLLLTSAGDWWWRATQSQANQTLSPVLAPAQHNAALVKPDLTALVANLEQQHQRMNGWYALGAQGNALRAVIAAADPTMPLDVTLQAVNAQGDQAVVEVIIYDKRGAPVYRQTRFYGRTNAGWQQTAPDATLWGPEQSLATPYFRYHFRHQDAAVVSVSAPQMDALYTTLWRNFGLPSLPPAAKRIIEVSVTQPPGQTPPWFAVANPIVVPSPTLYLAPVEWNDAELLAQSLALPLLDQVLTEAVHTHAIRPSWKPILNGLRLWQVWDLGLPLGAWRRDVVQWLYTDRPTPAAASMPNLPAHYPELCTLHQLWLSDPWQIPLGCSERERAALQTGWWRQRHLPRSLTQLAVPILTLPASEPGGALAQITYPGQTVVFATLIEYVVASYGRERLPVLVAGLGRYDNWATLIPAVFGVSTREFEAGWQAYLAAHYGVAPTPFRR